MKTKSLFLVFTCMTMFVCGLTYASPIAPWASGTANWQATDISSSPAPYTPDAVSVGTTPTSVTLQFRAVTPGQEANWFPVGKLRTGDGAGTLLEGWSSYASSVSPLYGITFKLTNDGAVAPTDDGLRMYFISEGNTFYSSILTAPASGSQTFTRLLSDFTGLGATTFTTVTEFGFEIASYNSLSAHSYTFEDIGLTQVVPEPETVWMMLVVLASLAITFRQRLADVAGQIKARFVA